MTRSATREGRFARAIASALEAANGRPVVLSPRDFAIVSDWFDRGVPLEIVLESLEEAAARKRRGRGGRRGVSIPYLVRAVEESWLALREARSSGEGGPGLAVPRAPDVAEAWRTAAAATPALLEAVSGALALFEREGDPERADATLDDALPESAPEAAVAAAEAEAERALAPFARRMTAEALASTRRRAVADRLRRALGLPRLALAEPPGGRTPDPES